MSYNQAYNAYCSTNIKTASQGHLIVLLYEGAVKQLSIAKSYFEADGKIKACNIEKFNNCLQKAEAIITELEVSLDMEKGGEIAKNLMSLYIFFNGELMTASIKCDKQKLEFVLAQMEDLAETWRRIASSAKNAPAATIAGTLNIKG